MSSSESLEKETIETIEETLEKSTMEKELSFVPVTAPTWALTLMSMLTLLSGACNTLLAKLQNRQFVPNNQECLDSGDPSNPAPPEWDEDQDGQYTCWSYFQGPLYQTLLMYIGEWWCQWIWLFEMWLSKKRGLKRPVLDLATSSKSIQKPHCPIYFWILPTCIDWIASTMINQAFVISYASTVQIMRNFNVLITALLTIFYLKNALRMRHWLGCVFLTAGMILTGMYGILNPDTDTNIDAGKAFIGILLALVSTTLHAFQHIYEEALLRKYFCSPFEGVGWMGLFGVVISIVVLLVMEYAVPDGEKTSVTFFNAGYSGTVLGAQIGYLFSVCIFNGAGLSVAKLASALLRTVLTSARGVIVWIVELSLQWAPFDAFSLCGMLLVTIGSLVYQLDILWNPCSSVKQWCNRPIICAKFMKNPDSPKEEIDYDNVVEEKQVTDEYESMSETASDVES
eukprot:GHVP01037636.1.p1 GENE.GHVP01037636.1~~GHVP01037636.1.p1  ORF type:complete len:455 (+),score=60.49 GHVP01037636.1:53-1417(+)